MHTDDFNKSSKIFDICIYILFIISFTYSVRYFVKASVSPTMSAINNYLLGCNFQQCCVYPLQLGVVRALKNVEITYLLNSNNNSEKTQ